MGRAPSRSKKKRDKSQGSVQACLKHAQEALEADEYEVAFEALSRGSEEHPDSIELLDAFGSLCAEMGENDKAMEAFQKSVRLAPDVGFEKYLYLGQMLVGDESFEHMRKGIDILERELLLSTGEKQVELQTQLCRAVCGLAELTLNQAEEPSSVQEEVNQLLNKAISLDETCPEPLQVMASLYIEVDKSQEAMECLKRSMSLWYSFPDSEEAGTNEFAPTLSAGTELPAYEFRFETAKLLLELGDFAIASDVLEGLLEEADSSLDVWYLLSIAQHSLGDHEDARESICRAAKLMKGLSPEDDYVMMFAELHESVEHSLKEEKEGTLKS